MNKKALCLGINTYRVKPLIGAVNDANDWADLLVKHYDFVRDDVQLLTDADATKGAIVAGLKGLLTHAQSGDVLVFVNSSHGTQVRHFGDADEPIDEAICPVDYPNGVLVDDELRTLFGTLPAGVSLTVIADSCHSGTLTREDGENVYPAEYEIRERFLDWEFLPDPLELTLDSLKALLATKKQKKAVAHPETAMREILLAGSRDEEASHDAPFGGRYGGVLTHYALQAIREAAYRLTYEQLGARTAELVAGTRFSSRQHPQLEGRADNRARQIFT